LFKYCRRESTGFAEAQIAAIPITVILRAAHLCAASRRMATNTGLVTILSRLAACGEHLRMTKL